MKCNVCGAESGKYPLCRVCNDKRNSGEVIKCVKCGKWHFANYDCSIVSCSDNEYLYEIRRTLITKSEQNFYHAIKSSLPDGYYAFPQVNLASFINRTDSTRYHNELFRNVDFLITDSQYRPRIVVEINDQTHFNEDRKKRDEKVRKICEEAGIPILRLWTSYGVNVEYIKGKIEEILHNQPMPRIHHFSQLPSSIEPVKAAETTPQTTPMDAATEKKGCYIATCVYGSYDCPKVWMLRRFRDEILAPTWYGRLFIDIYYAISPTLVKWFGTTKWFQTLWRNVLNRFICKLQKAGIDCTPYDD